MASSADSVFPSPGEWKQALDAAAARYPIGRLGIIVGADLRYSRMEREEALTIMEKTL